MNEKKENNSKKGVFSFLYLFSIFSYLLIIISVYLIVYERISSLENKIFILEERVGRELELKHAIKRVIIYSEQINTAKDVIVDILKIFFPEFAPIISQINSSIYNTYGVNRLSDLQSTGTHSYYHWRDFALHFWCGYPSENEIKSKIAIKGRYPDYFKSMGFDLPFISIDDELDGKNICHLFLSTSINTSTTISKPDPAKFKISTDEIGTPLNLFTIKYGVMIYDSKENISSAVIIPESTEIPWDDYLGFIKK